MTCEKNYLLKKIEQRREEMVELGLHYSFADERVVKVSDQLDQLLNKYYHLEKGQADN